MQVPNAHSAGLPITSLAFGEAGHTMLSRSMDNSVKLWDLRKWISPVAERQIPTSFAQSNAVFSPDYAVVAAGVSSPFRPGPQTDPIPSRMILMSSKNLSLLSVVELSTGAIKIAWHPKLNQIFAGTNDGSTLGFFDPDESSKGIASCVARTPRSRRPDDDMDEIMAQNIGTVLVANDRGNLMRALNPTGENLIFLFFTCG
jgi:WD40 repeat protein